MNLWDIVSCHTQKKLKNAGYVIVHRRPTESMLQAAKAGGLWIDEDEALATFRLMVKESWHIQRQAMEKARREIEERSQQDMLFELEPRKQAEAV